jgi:hypothetical protein
MSQNYKSAILVIDMQTKYLAEYLDGKDRGMFELSSDNHPLLYLLPRRAKRMIKRQEKMLEDCISLNIPIGLVERKGKGETIPSLKKIWYDSFPKIDIKKDHQSAFENTPLEEDLEEIGVKNIILIGINAKACVWESAKEGLAKGFKVFTSPDLIDNTCGSSTRTEYWWYSQNGVWVKKRKKLLEGVLSA